MIFTWDSWFDMLLAVTDVGPKHRALVPIRTDWNIERHMELKIQGLSGGSGLWYWQYLW